jgi:hypothetical protein
MKLPFIPIAVAFLATLILLMPACASRKEAPDPILVQKEIAEYRAQEIDLIRSTVLNRERADQLIELLGKRDQLVSESVEIITAYRKEMAALNVNYYAKRESFDMLMANYNRQRRATQHEFVALIGAIKKTMTADEWKIISRYQLKRLHPRKLTYDQALGEV